MKSVARKSDITAIPGKKPFTGATEGTWTAGDIDVTTVAVSSDGGDVVVAATCVFTFDGKNIPPPPAPTVQVNGSSTVVLTGGPSALTFGGAQSPLLTGDSKSDGFDNSLTVTSSATLHVG